MTSSIPFPKSSDYLVETTKLSNEIQQSIPISAHNGSGLKRDEKHPLMDQYIKTLDNEFGKFQEVRDQWLEKNGQSQEAEEKPLLSDRSIKLVVCLTSSVILLTAILGICIILGLIVLGSSALYYSTKLI